MVFRGEGITHGAATAEDAYAEALLTLVAASEE